MPKGGGDSLCPLGFHPQFRRPSYCKRCFREYGEHKSAKESSSTSINSLSYERNDLYGSKDSLSRSRNDLSGSTEEDDRYSKRPMSWSAQDLRKAVTDAKQTVRTTKEEVKRYYGSSRSLSQDLGTLSHILHDEPLGSTKEDDKGRSSSSSSTTTSEPKKSSFSSYLAMRTKSPARPPSSKSTSLQNSSTTATRLEDIKDDPTESKGDDETPTKSILCTTALIKPPKLPSKLKPEKVLPFVETKEGESRSEKSKKIIESLREVKSEDADASYVIRIRPKRSVSDVKKVEIDLQPEVERLQKENKELQQQLKEGNSKYEQLENENKELLSRKPKFLDLKKQSDISKLQAKIEELNEEIKKKNKDVKDFKKEIEKRPLPKDVEKTMEDLRSKLTAAEQLCEELMDENEDYKKEVRTLEDEIEEMQDNFREEQADEYRDLKRELEHRAKDCRVLQFKLKKAERRSEQLERDKGEFEDKLRELQVGDDDIGRAERVKGMEKELNLAKEVSMKMHEEMEKMKSQLALAETDKKKLKEKVQKDIPKPGAKVSRSQVLGRQGSQDNMDQVLRDLQDSVEREQDLKEQLKFAEEETKNTRKKLSRIEEENETLQLQLNKMSSKAKQTRQRSMERTGSLERSGSVEKGSLSRQGSTEKPVVNGEGEDIDPTEMKIQLELNEQESTILRRKVENLESENMRLQKELKDLLSTSDSPKKAGLANIPEITKDNVYFNKKIKSLEEECSDLRKKVSDHETEKDFLKTELENVKRRAKLVRSRSQEQAEAEERRLQETLEKEIETVKEKYQDLEDKYESIADENKRLTLRTQKRLPLTMQENMYIEKNVLEDKVKRLEKRLKDALEKTKISPTLSNSSAKTSPSSRVAELQAKVNELQNECNRLSKENADIKSLSTSERTPKKPRDLTPKPTLIKWVNELEAECSTLHAALKDAERKQSISRSDAGDSRDLEDKLQRAKERNEELTRQLREEREKVDEKMSQRVSGMGSRESDLRHYEGRIKQLKKELEEEREKNDNLQSDLKEGPFIGFEELRSAQTEKHRLQKELATSQQIANATERKLKESEETLKISEKAERNLRNLLEKAEARLEEERSSQSTLEGRQKDMTMSWLKERDDLKKEVAVFKKNKDSVEREIKQNNRMIKSLESQLESERKKTEDAEGKMRNDNNELKKLRREYDALETEADDLKDTISRMGKEKDKSNLKQLREIEQLKKEKEDLSIRMTTIETEIKTERKKRERLERDSSLGLRGKTSELIELKDKLAKAEQEKLKQSIEQGNWKDQYETKINSLEKRLSQEKKETERLQAKYDTLKEEFDLQKAQLSSGNKGNLTSGSDLKEEFETLEQELKTLRETYVSHQDKWIKEKLELQMQLKEYKDRIRGGTDNGIFSEKLRLKNIIDDKNQQLEIIKGEMDTFKDQLSYYKRESEDLRSKLDDLEKLQELAEKHQGPVSTVDTTGFESTIKDLRTRLSTLERTHKSDTTKMKMRYDAKVKALSEEVSAVTQHMSKYRRERDTYKEMLDGAQKTIADLKGSSGSSYRTSRADNVTEIAAAAKRQADHQAKSHLTEVQDLQSFVTELEDKLADSRLALTKSKNEIVDQKTNLEIQLSDMQTKLNEYEEDRLLGGGGRRVPGLRTRLELNWQKEREEQQRLLHETATLAKDLRQTLYEVEREKDMDRLEAKRKIEQLKRTVNQDHHDTKSKVQELQRDLQELREAHAKLRQINEKLRREKDRTEVEREAMRDKFLGSSREHLNHQSKMERLLDELKTVKELAPLVLGEGIDGKDTITDLPAEPKPRTKDEFTDALRKVTKTSDEMRVMMNLGDDRDRIRRTPSFRKALSTESDDECTMRSHSAGRRGPHRPVPRGQKSQLYRKSQSLDHQLAEEKGKIWVSTDGGSTSSIESSMTDDARRKHDLDRSLDRISTGSQTSDLDLTSDQKKKGLKGMFAKLTKSRSIEDSSTGGSIVGVGLKAMAPGMTGSGNSITSESDKTSVKGRLKTMFMKGTSPPRSLSSDANSPSVKKITNQFEGDSSTTTTKVLRSTVTSYR